MRLILTGACGHIGSYISKNIFKINKIKEIILIDNFNTQRYSSLFNLKKKPNVYFFNKDLIFSMCKLLVLSNFQWFH